MEKTPNQKVKGFFVDEGVLTIIIKDTNTSDTVIQFIKLDVMEQVVKEEAEK